MELLSINNPTVKNNKNSDYYQSTIYTKTRPKRENKKPIKMNNVINDKSFQQVPMSKNFNYYPRKFPDTITSWGLIPFNKRTHKKRITIDDILFLLQQRRDTFEYVDFVFGTWKNYEDLTPIFTNFSQEERARVRNYIFFELWEDIWINKTSKQYKDNYQRAKRRYDSIKHMIPFLLDSTQSSVIGPTWGFPKGRKNNMNESDVECAIRETEEETRIDRSKFNILYNSGNPGEYINQINKKNKLTETETKFSERFQGTNGMSYTTIYYLTEVCDTDIPMDIMTPNCIRQTSFSEESTCVKWVTYNEACKYLNQRRQTILQESLKSIIKYYNEVIV